VVDGDVIWEGPDGYYHHYPSMPQVRAWLAEAGFAIEAEAGDSGTRRATPTTMFWPAWRPMAEEYHPWHLDRPLLRRRKQPGYRG
jgi:hypothetical protein